MLKSIGKYSKSFFIKALVGIIILPFLFWGMGDVFRGGNQNIIVTIDSNKVSTQEFTNYLNRLGLSEQERKNISKSNLLEKILSDYIGKKVVSYEVDAMGVRVSDASLRDIITNDKTFFKDGKFSRTTYEKFLLESSLSAPQFEMNIKEQEKRRQLLSFLSEGIAIPDFLIEKEFKKENQIKTIKYIDLNNFYDNEKIDTQEIKKIFEENKEIFVEIYKTLSFVELTPKNLSGQKDYNKNYFDKIEKIENEILDGEKIEVITKKYNIELLTTEEINKDKNNIYGTKFNGIKDDLFLKIFLLNNTKSPRIINIENKYYLAEISSSDKKNKDLKDKKVLNSITDQIKIQNKIKKNSEIIKKISSKDFSVKKFEDYALKNKLLIKDAKINKLTDNEIFSKNLIQNIFNTKTLEFNLITDSRLTKNFIIFTEKTDYIKLDKNSETFKTYKSKTKLNFAKNIYEIYDKTINSKYDIDVNNKVIDRIKNSF